MTATINGTIITGTPREIAELLQLINPPKLKITYGLGSKISPPEDGIQKRPPLPNDNTYKTPNIYSATDPAWWKSDSQYVISAAPTLHTNTPDPTL